MKTIMGILLVLLMAFAVVPIFVAGTGPAAHGYSGATFAPNCVSTPAYTHYVGVNEVPCPVNIKIPLTPNPMGGW